MVRSSINWLFTIVESSTSSSNTTLSSPVAATTAKGVTSTSRRMIKKLVVTVGTSLVAGTALVALPSGKEAQAKLVGNPTGVNNQIGAFVSLPGAANPIHTPNDNTIKFGLVASSSTAAFDMASLLVGNDVAV